MRPIIFKGTNNTKIEVYFRPNNFGFQPVLLSGQEIKPLPLLMDFTQIIMTNRKLLCLNREKEYPLEYLKNVVAGACSLTMKRGA